MLSPGEAKWSLPGWRIEQKYDTSVLIGNWSEERRKVVCFHKFSENRCGFLVSGAI